MIRAGFLDPELRSDLIDLGRDGSWLTDWLCANVLVSLDDGMSCGDVARVLLLDDYTAAVPGIGCIGSRVSKAWRALATKAAPAA